MVNGHNNVPWVTQQLSWDGYIRGIIEDTRKIVCHFVIHLWPHCWSARSGWGWWKTDDGSARDAKRAAETYTPLTTTLPPLPELI